MDRKVTRLKAENNDLDNMNYKKTKWFGCRDRNVEELINYSRR